MAPLNPHWRLIKLLPEPPGNQGRLLLVCLQKIYFIFLFNGLGHCTALHIVSLRQLGFTFKLGGVGPVDTDPPPTSSQFVLII